MGKPLIMKPWNAEMDMEKEELKSFPIRVQLMLNIKYWEEKALFKIGSQIGRPLKRDDAKKNRDKCEYARILVEVAMN